MSEPRPMSGRRWRSSAGSRTLGASSMPRRSCPARHSVGWRRSCSETSLDRRRRRPISEMGLEGRAAGLPRDGPRQTRGLRWARGGYRGRRVLGGLRESRPGDRVRRRGPESGTSARPRDAGRRPHRRDRARGRCRPRIAVHIGARVSAKAGPGEIFVTRTVRDVLLGSGVALEGRGGHVLKGVPGEWELFSVTNADGL